MDEKRIFFLSNIFNEKKAIGITKKVHNQINSFKSLGYTNINYTSYYDNYLAVLNQNDEIIYKKYYKFNNRFYKRFFKNQELKKMGKEFLLSADTRYEFCYLRYMFFDKSFLSLLKTCKEKSKKNIVEAHSYPIFNKYDYLFYPVYFINFLFTKRCSKYIDLVAAISDKDNIWNTKTVKIDNAININDYKITKRIPNKRRINLIFVGFEYNIHGIDRLLKSMSIYYSQSFEREVHLFLVGNILKKTKKLIKKYKLDKYVTLFGIQQGKELDKIFDESDIGIGILAPYRRNSTLGTGLKTKEYMARGLPVIFAGVSLSTANDCPYVYKLENNKSIINMINMVKFYDNISSDSNMHLNIRKTVSKLTWEKEFNKILESI